MIDVKKLLFEICEDERVFEPDIDLYESGIMDSYSTIELIARLEDEGIIIHLTRIDRELLHTVSGIEQIIEESK